MLCKEGFFVGDGSRKIIDVGFNPAAVFAWRTSSSSMPSFHTSTFWMGRTNGMGDLLSFMDGIIIRGTEVIFGTSTNIQASGSRTYWAVIGEDGTNDFEIIDYMGNGLDGRIVDLSIQKQVQSLFIKRDAAYTGIMRVSGGSATGFLDGVTTPGNAISALGVGQFTVNNFTESNHYDAPLALGEGHAAFALFSDCANADVVSWVGAQAQYTVIPTPNSDPAFAIVYEDGSTVPACILSRSMLQDAVKPLNTSAADSNELALVYGGLKISGSLMNEVGKTYRALVVGRNDSYQKKVPNIIIKGNKAVYLPGGTTRSGVLCGNSDATLKIDGAISIEWWGINDYIVDANVDKDLIVRGNGPYGAGSGRYSWGMYCANPNEGLNDWSTPSVLVINRDYISNSSGDMDVAPWRTGILMGNNKPSHLVATHDGSGSWRLFLNGRLVKQRRQSLSPNIQSGAGHYTCLGGRWSTSQISGMSKCLIEGASVWSRELTMAEVDNLYAVRRLGATNAVSQTGLAEQWLASEASGTSMPATVNAANDGTITLGRVVRL